MFAVMVLFLISAGMYAEPASVADTTAIHDRIKGALVGSALADALGRITEPLSTAEQIKHVYGSSGVTSVRQMSSCEWIYEPYKRKQAAYTSNTVLAQLAYQATIDGRKRGQSDEEIIEAIAEAIVDLFGSRKYALDNHFGFRRHSDYCIKTAEHLTRCRLFNRSPLWWIVEKEDKTICQPLAENESGALARAWPIGLVFADREERIFSLARYQTLITHGHPSVAAASAALAVGTAYSIKGESIDRIVKEMVLASEHYENAEQAYKPSAKKMKAHDKEPILLEKNHYYTSDMINYCASQARAARKLSQFLPYVSQELGSTADEMISVVVYILVKHADNPKNAIAEAVNLGGRTSLLASLVGALVGARCGFATLKEIYGFDIDMLENVQSFYEASDELAQLAYGREPESRHQAFLSRRVIGYGFTASLLGIAGYLGYTWLNG